MSRVPLFLAAVLALSADPSLPNLFQKAKQEFKLGNYQQALATLETLDTESAKPGQEAERQKMRPAVLFYEGASLAALGRSEEAEQAFEEFLVLSPNASLDPALYPSRVKTAFENARRKVTASVSGKAA